MNHATEVIGLPNEMINPPNNFITVPANAGIEVIAAIGSQNVLIIQVNVVFTEEGRNGLPACCLPMVCMKAVRSLWSRLVRNWGRPRASTRWSASSACQNLMRHYGAREYVMTRHVVTIDIHRRDC